MTRKLLFLWVMLGMVMSNAAAQGRQVTGTVKDKDGASLPGVSIRETGTNNGTATGVDGKFALTLKSTSPSLEFTFMGYAKAIIKVDGRAEYAVVMQADAQSLKDVVVVGYQTVTKKTATTAISAVKGDVIENLPAPSFESLLQGRVSGVNVQNFSGDPGVRGSFVVRGNSRLSSNLDEARALSSPLYVIDGVPMNMDDMANFDNTQTNSIAGINPNDIEEMQILKDAAATSVWGSRGANGVIVVKTRKGKTGKPEFRMNYYQGLVSRPRLLPTVTGTEERRLKMGILNEYASWQQLADKSVVLTDSLNPSFNNATDWQDMFYRDGGVKNADLSISNGTEKFNYRISANYYDEQGVVRNTGFSRYALRANLNYNFSEKLSGFTIVALSRTNRKRGLGNDRFASSVPVQMHELPSSLLLVSPEKRQAYMDQFDKLRDVNQNDLITASIGINYKILPGLEYRFMGSVNATANKRAYFLPSTLDPDGINRASNENSDYNTYYFENTLAYTKTLAEKHHLSLSVTQNFERNIGTKVEGGNANQPNDDIQVIGGGPQQYKSVASTYSAAGLLSYIGQLQYDFNEKYLLSGSWRADASSRFGPDSKWGQFVSAGAGWVASEESFFEPIKDVVSYMKVRGSWGTSGEQFEDFYAPYNRFVIPGYYNGGPAYLPDYDGGYGITKRNFTWSKSRQFNVGFEAFIFKGNRINLTVDYYDKLSGRAFNTFEMPFWAGYNSLTANYDINIRNRGLEITILSKNLPENSPVKWNTNLNLSFNQSRITKLPNGDKTYYREDKHGVMREYTVGKAPYTMSQMLYGGVYSNWASIPFNPANGTRITYFKGNQPVKPGYPVWYDLNGDWDVWSDEDKGDPRGDITATGDPNPGLTGGFVNDVYWKNWSLTIATTFTVGRDLINSFKSSELDRTFGGGYLEFGARRMPDLEDLNYWKTSEYNKQGEGYRADYPALNPYLNYYQFFPFSSMFNESGDYLKVKFISLGYTFGKPVTDRLKISNLRLYGTIDNLLMLQRASVPDAEQVDPFGIYTGSGYPIPRKFTLGVDVKF